MSARRRIWLPPQRAPAKNGCIGRRQRWTMAEHVETCRFDVLEDPHPSEPGKSKFPAKPPVNGIADRASGPKQFPRAFGCHSQRLAPLRGYGRAVEVVFLR